MDLLNERDAEGRLKGRRTSLEHVNCLEQLQYCKACFPVTQRLKWGLRSRNPKTGKVEAAMQDDAALVREASIALPLLAARAEAEVAKEDAASSRKAQTDLAARLEQAETELKQASLCGLLDARKENVNKEKALMSRENAVAEREEQLRTVKRKLDERQEDVALLERNSRRKILGMEEEARWMERRVSSSEKTLLELLATHNHTRKALLKSRHEAAEEKRRRDELMIVESDRLNVLEKERRATSQEIAELLSKRMEIEVEIQKSGQHLADLEAHRQGQKRSLGGEVKALYQQREGLEKQVAKLQDDVRRNLEVCHKQGVPTTPLPPEMLEPLSSGWQPRKSDWLRGNGDWTWNGDIKWGNKDRI